MKRVFFTGATGFLGSNLVKYLKKNFGEIYIFEFTGKVESYKDLESEFKKEKWDYIFHFAGMSHVTECESSPQKAYEINVLGTTFICQLAREYGFRGKLFFTSTALNYQSEKSLTDIIYNENSIITPKGVYGWTKYFSEKLLEAHSESHLCQVYILRLFNHTHKTQSANFFLPSIYKQISDAKDGESIRVGNIDVIRDFSLISEFCEKFVYLLNEEQLRETKIVTLSSGVGRNLRNLVEKLIERSGKKLNIVIDMSLVRQNDPESIIGLFSTSYSNKLTDEEFIDAFLAD